MLAVSATHHKAIRNIYSGLHKTAKAWKNNVYGSINLTDFQSRKLRSFTSEKLFSHSNILTWECSSQDQCGTIYIYAQDVVRNTILRGGDIATTI